MLKENPTILFLFVIIAILDFAALTALFLSHSKPFLSFLGPIIRAFWGETFLHYPENFLLLPKLYKHAHFVITSAAGIVITGAVIKKIEGYFRDERVSTLAGAGAALKKYFSLLAVWIASYFVVLLSFRHLLPILPAGMAVQLGASYLMALLLQSLFAYLMPAVMLSGEGFLPSVKQGLIFAFRRFPVTAGLIAVPILGIIFLAFLKSLAPLFVRFYPEAVLVILGLNILITTAVDLVMTTATTVLFVKERTQR